MKKLLLSAALLVSAGAIFGASGERTRPTAPAKPANLGNFTVINNSDEDVLYFWHRYRYSIRSKQNLRIG